MSIKELANNCSIVANVDLLFLLYQDYKKLLNLRTERTISWQTAATPGCIRIRMNKTFMDLQIVTSMVNSCTVK